MSDLTAESLVQQFEARITAIEADARLGVCFGWLHHNLYLSRENAVCHVENAEVSPWPSQRACEEGALACYVRNGKGEGAQAIDYSIAKKAAVEKLKALIFQLGEAQQCMKL